MNCKICFENYDNNNRKPMIILPCAHSFCSSCVLRIETCSTCRQAIVDRKPNYDLLENLDQFICVSNELRQSIVKDLKEIENLNFEISLLNILVLEKVQLKFDSATKSVVDQIEEYKKQLLAEIDLIKKKSIPTSDDNVLQIKELNLLDLVNMKAYQVEIQNEKLKLESNINQMKQLSINQIDNEIAKVLSTPLNLITNSKNEDSSSQLKSLAPGVSSSINNDVSKNVEFKITKKIKYFKLISDVYKTKQKHCVDILDNSNYILVYQQNNKDLACLIFDQNTKVIKSKIIDSDCGKYLTNLLIKVFSGKIICLYSTSEGWYISVLDARTLAVIKSKEMDIKEYETFYSICASGQSIDILTKNTILKYSWSLNKIYQSIENESFFLQNSKRILQIETKHNKYFILYKEKNDCNYYNTTKLAIMNKNTGFIEKSVEVDSSQFLFDSNENLIFVLISKILTLNLNGDLVNESASYELLSQFFYKKILFISDSKDKMKISNESELSIEFYE